MMEFNTALLYSNSSKMANGNMLLLILEFHIILKVSYHYMDTVLISLSFGFHLWKKHMQSCMVLMR